MDYNNPMKIKDLIKKLDRAGKDKKITLSVDEACTTIYGEICLEEVGDEVILFPLEDSETF